MAVLVEGAVLGGDRLQVLVLLHLHLQQVPSLRLQLLDPRGVRGGLLGRELAPRDGVLLLGLLLEAEDVLVEALEALLRGPELALELLVVERRVPAARVEPVVLDVEDLGAAPDGGARRGCGGERGVVVGVGERARVGVRFRVRIGLRLVPLRRHRVAPRSPPVQKVNNSWIAPPRPSKIPRSSAETSPLRPLRPEAFPPRLPETRP